MGGEGKKGGGTERWSDNRIHSNIVKTRKAFTSVVKG